MRSAWSCAGASPIIFGGHRRVPIVPTFLPQPRSCCPPSMHVTVCSDGMDVILGRLRTNLVVMEEFHQGVYLGFDKLTRPAIDVYNVWTQHAINYTVGAWPRRA